MQNMNKQNLFKNMLIAGIVINTLNIIMDILKNSKIYFLTEDKSLLLNILIEVFNMYILIIILKYYFNSSKFVKLLWANIVYSPIVIAFMIILRKYSLKMDINYFMILYYLSFVMILIMILMQFIIYIYMTKKDKIFAFPLVCFVVSLYLYFVPIDRIKKIESIIYIISSVLSVIIYLKYLVKSNNVSLKTNPQTVEDNNNRVDVIDADTIKRKI